MDIPYGATLAQAIAQIKLPTQRIAVAVNNQMVPRTKWGTLSLCENDQLVIIKAACGG